MAAIKAITPSRESRFSDLQNHPATSIPPLRLWEIDPFFKCPVIGMCLSLAEQKQILKRLGISTKKKSAYEIHETFVANSDTENRISKRVEALLNRKYGVKNASYLDLDAEEFMTHFKTAFESGRYAELFWIATINPKLSPDMKREIFGDIHMVMHWNIEQYGNTKGRLVRQEKALHDGYMKRGSKYLESCLKRADMVLCPVSCNSHAACDMVKNLAKKYKKPIHMLANSSLNTFSQVMRETKKKEQTTSC